MRHLRYEGSMRSTGCNIRKVGQKKRGPDFRLPPGSLLDADGADRTAVPGILGAGQLIFRDLAAVGQAIIAHGKAHGTGAGAQAAADAVFIDSRVHEKASLSIPLPARQGRSGSVPACRLL